MSTAVEEILGSNRVVVLLAVARVAQKRARVTGQGRPAGLESQPANVDGHPVVFAVLRIGSRRRRQQRSLVAAVVIGRCRLGVHGARDDVTYDDVT